MASPCHGHFVCGLSVCLLFPGSLTLTPQLYLHSYGFSLSWTLRMWSFSLSPSMKPLSHCEHGNLFSLMWTRNMCLLRFFTWVEHFGHGCRSLWDLFLCICILNSPLKTFSHKSHLVGF